MHELLCVYLVNLKLDHAVRVHCQCLGLMHRRVANHQGNLQATILPVSTVVYVAPPLTPH